MSHVLLIKYSLTKFYLQNIPTPIRQNPHFQSTYTTYNFFFPSFLAKYSHFHYLSAQIPIATFICLPILYLLVLCIGIVARTSDY